MRSWLSLSIIISGSLDDSESVDPNSSSFDEDPISKSDLTYNTSSRQTCQHSKRTHRCLNLSAVGVGWFQRIHPSRYMESELEGDPGNHEPWSKIAWQETFGHHQEITRWQKNL